MTMASAGGLPGPGAFRCPACLSGQLDILRLMTRGLARRRRRLSRRVISATPRANALVSRSGGKTVLAGYGAPHEPQGAGEGQPVGVDVGIEGGGVHQLADGPVDQQEAPDFLLDAVG